MRRRVIFILLSAAVVAAVSGSNALAGSHRRAAAFPGCGPNHPPTATHEFPCSKPVIHVIADPACQKPGTYTLPPIHVKANGGMRKVTIKLGRFIVKIFRFHRSSAIPSLRGPRFKTFRGIRIRSKRLLTPGRHTMEVLVLDWTGKKAHKRFPIAVCKPPPPPFTG
jgi:hypothetical protein